MPCPFESKKGFSTDETREEYIKVHFGTINSTKMTTTKEKGESSSDNNNGKDDENNKEENKEDNNNINDILSSPSFTSLEADLDITKPLYYWQLYSILGKEPIEAFLTVFYTRIFNDHFNNDWFRCAFANVSDDPKVHIQAQSKYWIDAFGGGKVYWGGLSRLGFHHYSNHAEPVMNANGAKRWMWHMKHAIRSYDFTKIKINNNNNNNNNDKGDPRIVPCLVEFLRVKVIQYSKEHDWEFDDSDCSVPEFTFGSNVLPKEPLQD